MADDIPPESSMEHDGVAVGQAFHVNRSQKRAIDQHLIDSATAALQSLERFHLDLKDKRSEQPDVCDPSLEEGGVMLETMRNMKSRIEGTLVDLPRPQLSESALQKLKTFMLMHMPRTMTKDVKKNFYSLIQEAMPSTGCTLIYAGLAYCPWYVSTQPEIGQQAKHNSILIVFANPDNLTFSPANPHSKEQTEVIDEGWLYAVEASHFTKYLVKGKSRIVDSLFTGPESVIMATPVWNHLLETISKPALIGLQPFLEQCRGQAIGAVAKKSKKTGRMKLNDNVSLYDFCQSFKLLQCAVQALTTHTLEVSTLNVDQLDGTYRAAHDMITTMYAHESDGRTKEDLFDLLCAAKADVDALMKAKRFTPFPEVEREVSRWLLHLRAGDRVPTANPGLPDGQRESLKDLMRKVGGPVAIMAPENIVVIVRAGSFLYDLHTPESDVDYLVVYTEPTTDLLSSVKRIAECKENRGPNKEIEYGAYEARLFAEMLIKGSVVTSEIVYRGEAEYASEAWKELCSQRHLFVTENVIQQYMGLISNNLHTIQVGRHQGAPRERKIFYQIFHKLWSVEEMLAGRTPEVRCSGSMRDFIMSIRRGPLEGDISREQLYSKAEKKVRDLRRALAERPRRLPENADLSYLTDWLMALRGWNNLQQ